MATSLDLARAAYTLARRHYLRLILPALAGHTLAAYLRRLVLGTPELRWLIPLALLLGPALIAFGEATATIRCVDIVRDRPQVAIWPRLRPALPALLGGAVIKWLLVVTGMVLLVVPGMYLLSLYFVVPAVSLLEGVGIRRAQQRSALLARRDLGRMFGTVAIHDALLFVVPTLAQLAIFGFGVAIPPWSWYLLWLVPALVAPVRIALVVLVYFDARGRMESEAPGGVAPFPF